MGLSHANVQRLHKSGFLSYLKRVKSNNKLPSEEHILNECIRYIKPHTERRIVSGAHRTVFIHTFRFYVKTTGEILFGIHDFLKAEPKSLGFVTVTQT